MKVSALEVFLALFVLEAVFAFMFIKAGWPESTKKGFVYKMIASAVFVAAGMYAFLSVSRESYYSVAILAGLISGFAGDIFLTLDPFIRDKKSKLNTAAIITGGLFFLFGHICYICAFVREMLARRAFSPLITAVFWAGAMLVIIGLKLILNIKAGKLTVPVFIYALVLTFMAACAVCLAKTQGGFISKAIIICAPVLFIISDFSLMIKFFDKERFNTLPIRALNLGTYYLSQMLLAVSIYALYKW